MNELQTVFDTVVNHLRQQGKVATDGNGHCRYKIYQHSGQLLMCAAGCLIPENEYRLEFEGSSVMLTSDGKPVTTVTEYFLTKYPLEVIRLIMCLQDAHDTILKNFSEEIEAEFSRIASRFNLNYVKPIFTEQIT